jgi:hypothetical protein
MRAGGNKWSQPKKEDMWAAGLWGEWCLSPLELRLWYHMPLRPDKELQDSMFVLLLSVLLWSDASLLFSYSSYHNTSTIHIV